MTRPGQTPAAAEWHVPAPRPRMDDAGHGPAPGSPENALALYASLDTIQHQMSGPQRVAAMNAFAERQREHLQAVTGLHHEAHALVVTPAIRVGHLELGPLLFGTVLTLIAGAAVALGLRPGVGITVLGMSAFWLVCTALLNAAIRAARQRAVRLLIREAQAADGEA